MIVGRRTFFSLGRAPGQRWFLVVTRDPDLLECAGSRDYDGFGYWFMPSLDDAVATAHTLSQSHSAPELLVTGGALCARDRVSGKPNGSCRRIEGRLSAALHEVGCGLLSKTMRFNHTSD